MSALWRSALCRSAQCTLGEEVHLEKKIFENQFFKYQKITKNILTVEKKFHNFSTKNDQHFLGANFFLQNWYPKIKKRGEGGVFLIFFLHQITLNI